jgi:Neisseria PilC beta-propeller domain/FG-GAP-like repeat
MSHPRILGRFTSPAAVAVATMTTLISSPGGAAIPTCPATSSASGWVGAFLNTDTRKAGVVWDTSGNRLKLQGLGGDFKQSVLGISDTTMYAAAADFDKDGWQDYVGGDQITSFQLKYYANRTYQNPEPNWLDTSAVRTPKFVKTGVIDTFTFPTTGPTILLAADFNGDTWPDIVEINAPKGSSTSFEPTRAVVLLNAQINTSNGATFKTPYNAFKAPTTSRSLGYQDKEGTNAYAVDYNGDRKLDLIVGTSAGGGTIRIFTNNCTSPAVVPTTGLIPCTDAPTFSYLAPLVTGLGFTANSPDGLPIFAYEDFDGDGYRDLVVGAPGCCSSSGTEIIKRLRLFRGVSGGGLSTTAQIIRLDAATYFTGSAIGIFAADYSLDGKPDLIVATDDFFPVVGSNIGGQAWFWQNNGTSTPFSDPFRTKVATRGSSSNQTTDFDVGFVFNYDNDPWNTPDIMIADGNNSAKYFVFANRAVDKYVACGDAASGILNLGSLSSAEMVITAGRITPDATLNGGTIKYYMSNEEPANWVLATACPSSSTDLCVSFPKPVGREIRWKAVMCSNSSNTTTPLLRGISARFDYQRATEHYRAGVIINDGISYVGAFRQPGSRGHIYAINAALSTTYWDGASKLDATADSARNIYTAGRTLPTRLDFRADNTSNVTLQDTMMTADQTSIARIITWARSARFGIGNSGIPLSKLGAVESATPAILTKPARPPWYANAASADRSRVDAFVAANQTRVPLLIFGAKDGMIHALFTRPTDITNAINGKEAWAFVPPRIAAGMLADYTASQSGTLSIASYPDGSPTLADYYAGNGVMKTVAIVASGNGGRSITALDVTRTVAPDTNEVLGPTPMWSAVPGDADAGQAFAKPVVARVRIAGIERYVVVAGTGIDYTDTLNEKGRVVAGYDLPTGQLMWKFRTKCPLTSDLTAFETDDGEEPNTPTLDGYIDRVVFADKCGYVYKINPAADLAGAWYQNTGMGRIVSNVVDGKIMYALFSSAETVGALGSARPIAGTLAARTDASTRMVLFFGTGGLEDYPVGSSNEFYAIYADTGAIRSKLVGACASGRCEKFYGGVVVTPEQLFLTRSIDPQIGTSTCDNGTAKVEALQLNSSSSGGFVSTFQLQLASAVVGSVYGDAGAVYFATMAGDISRIGTPRATSAGGDSASGSVSTMSTSDTSAASTGTTTPLTLLGWREVM